MRHAAIAGAILATLIFGIVLGFVSALRLQDAETKYGPGITESSEAVARQTNREAGRKQGIPPPNPNMPIRVEEAERVSQAECSDSQDCRTEQRDYQDLRAQWKAADAAYGQYFLAFLNLALTAFGVIAAVFGTAGLIYSLFLTRRATNAAEDAVRVTQDTGERQIRAYVGVSQCAWVKQPNPGVFAAKVVFRNFGQSPAYEVKAYVRCTFFPMGEQASWDYEIPEHVPPCIIYPGDFAESEVGFEMADDVYVKMIASSTPVIFYFYGAITYRDAFKISRKTNFRYEWLPNQGERAKQFRLSQGGNEAN